MQEDGVLQMNKYMLRSVRKENRFAGDITKASKATIYSRPTRRNTLIDSALPQ